jgi:hypothetical protein
MEIFRLGGISITDFRPDGKDTSERHWSQWSVGFAAQDASVLRLWELNLKYLDLIPRILQ